ncbi:DUF2155 domain-containing protein [Croceicoccus naphthovorans]|uniref:Uncharacterized protein n=1 Tax=Croceicoccus naphthovorans TaxID=1348774 RepID=A0A0G3XDE0_9SPHN|nr:DUF2155 domain-containing protein [Croceicoccus naphthovorans]AKM09550.1 hypothetical protein AB433_05470 [Croceicoccus naphthovorans]MBB3989690.1 hypothetical protein [Croceicoccus naphthovorans]
MRIFAPLTLSAALALAACGSEPDATNQPGGVKTEEAVAAPAANETMAADADAAVGEDGLPQGTPMEQRIATLGLLNKRNNLTQDIVLKPGEQERVGDVLIKLATCERRPPWDPEPEEGAFVQVFTTEDRDDDDPDWTRVFSGWLFLNSPSLNVVEHPIYDVWIKDCAMTFPGEEEAANAAKPSGNGT